MFETTADSEWDKAAGLTCRAYFTARQLRGMDWVPPPVVEMRVSDATRSGAIAARRVATMPPMLWPTTCTFAHFRCS